jgi:hypothetical protein
MNKRVFSLGKKESRFTSPSFLILSIKGIYCPFFFIITIHPFIHSFIHPLFSFPQSLIISLLQFLITSYFHSFIISLFHSFILSFFPSFLLSFIPSFFYPFIISFILFKSKICFKFSWKNYYFSLKIHIFISNIIFLRIKLK